MKSGRVVLACLGAGILLTATPACGTGTEASGADKSGSADGAANTDKLIFAAIPSEQETDARQSYKTVIEMLGESTGRQVEFKQTTNYNGAIEGMKSGTVDVAALGPFSYVLARTVGAKITPVGVSVEESKEPTYHSYGIARGNDREVDSLEDFQGKKVCFVDPASTSGFLFPSAGLKEAGLDPETDVTPVMAGAHDLSVQSVKAGKCDVGFASDTMVDTTMPANGSLKPGELKVVWKSPAIPSSPVAMRDALPAEVKKKIVSTFIEKLNKDWLVENGRCKDADSCLVSGESAIWGYVPAEDKTYDPIRKVCNATQDEQCKGES
jgi:phosphonate transport system substrate-binding protein